MINRMKPVRDCGDWSRGVISVEGERRGRLRRRSVAENRAVHPNIHCHLWQRAASCWNLGGRAPNNCEGAASKSAQGVTETQTFFSNCRDKSKTVWCLWAADADAGCLLFSEVCSHRRLIRFTCLKQSEDAAEPQREMEEMLIMLVPAEVTRTSCTLVDLGRMSLYRRAAAWSLCSCLTRVRNGLLCCLLTPTARWKILSGVTLLLRPSAVTVFSSFNFLC